MPQLPQFEAERATIRKGLFTSDLHLFSPRSAGTPVAERLLERSREVDCIVLGGDIFDFRWSDRGSHQKTLDDAQAWLERFANACAPTWVAFLPGNHDCHPDFLYRLSRLSDRHDNFIWLPHHFRLGDCLFLHGDLLDAGGFDKLAGYRSQFHHNQPQPQWAHRGYDLAVGTRLHQLIPRLVHRPEATCQRLLGSLEVLQATPENSVETAGICPPELLTVLPSSAGEVIQAQAGPLRQVFFGHTHVPLQRFELDAIHFHNPGAALRHMQPEIHAFEAKPDGG
jgi:hypothetical protein